MNDRFVGIVLKQTDYRENDMIISVLLDIGKKVSLICRGVKKLTSKNAMSIRPFLSSEFIFDYDENKSIFNLKNANIKKSRIKMNNDLTKINLAALICQMVDSFIFDDEYLVKETYQLLDFSLDMLENTNNNFLSACFFCAKFLEIIGIAPYVNGCVFDDNKKIAGISINDGGFVCRECLHKTVILQKIKEEHLRKFRIINKADYENFSILMKDDNYQLEDLDLLVNFYIKHTDIKLSTYDFIKLTLA